MKKYYHFTFLILIIFFVITPKLQGQEQEDVFLQLDKLAVIDQKVMIPMRDGVRLATDIYRPKTSQKVQVIFSRTPYNFNIWQDGE